jgi:hypothetical protein
MKYILIALLLVGCSTPVPVAPKFPQAPKILLEKCKELKMTSEDATLSEIAKKIGINYESYHECSAKNDAWGEWYHKQKNIYESVK